MFECIHVVDLVKLILSGIRKFAANQSFNARSKDIERQRRFCTEKSMLIDFKQILIKPH